jgi:hypothetical protein
MFAGQEERMPDEEKKPDDTFQDQTPIYTFLDSSQADEYREIARIHRKEGKQLLEHAHQAEAEDRQEEAKLLMDLSIKWEERAEEFEKAARGEGGDPIVTEILESQDEMIEKTSIKYTPEFISGKGLRPARLPKHMRPPPPGRIDRALAKISNWWRQ